MELDKTKRQKHIIFHLISSKLIKFPELFFFKVKHFFIFSGKLIIFVGSYKNMPYDA